MTTFTDKNLFKLKLSLAGELPEFSTMAKSDLEVIKALLNRLSAAEKLLKPHVEGCEISVGMDCSCDMPRRWKAWRKACGKDKE